MNYDSGTQLGQMEKNEFAKKLSSQTKFGIHKSYSAF